VSAAFSGLPADLARDFETDAARAGIRVFSNASSHRMETDVPLLVPEVNAEHIAVVERQPTFERGGFIVTNPNCSVTGLVLALKPLVDAFDFVRVHVATYQALSGAGYPGVPSLDIEGNVLPFIDQEEEKMRREAKKLLGRWSGGIVPSEIEVWANCARVPVRDGHLEAVSIPLPEDTDPDEVAKILQADRSRKFVVVSAISGVTDSLVASLAKPREEKEIDHYIADLRRKHLALLPDSRGDSSVEAIGALTTKLERLLYGIAYTEETTPRSRDFVLSFGERLAAQVVAANLGRLGVDARAHEADAIGLFADDTYGNASALLDETRGR